MKKIDITSFQKKKYLENLKLLSKFRNEKSSAYIYLMATFISLSILLLFAVGPTISTIVELHKKLEDSKMAESALTTKIANLNALQVQYNQLSGDFPLINNALPNTPMVTDFLGRAQSLANSSNVTIVSLSSSKVPLMTQKAASGESPTPSFLFSLTISGTYTNTLAFFQQFVSFDRVITVSSFSMSRDDEDTNSSLRALTIEGKAYFQE